MDRIHRRRSPARLGRSHRLTTPPQTMKMWPMRCGMRSSLTVLPGAYPMYAMDAAAEYGEPLRFRGDESVVSNVLTGFAATAQQILGGFGG
jgi:hypothetical protein